MQIAVTEVISRALRLCGQSQAPGRGQSTEEVAELVGMLNQTIDGWNAMEERIYTANVTRYTLDPQQTSYTLGPQGSGADWVGPRPISIANANIVLTANFPEVRVSLTILDDKQWADISVRDYGTNVPTYLYYTKNVGAEYGTLYFVGYPTQANDVELYMWGALQSDLTSSDDLIVPEGYSDALIFTLAERCFPLYAKKSNKDMFPVVQLAARKARAAIVALNSQAPKQASDAPQGSSTWSDKGPFFNYYTGDGRQNR